MVATSSGAEKQSLLVPENDRGSNPTRGSFARLAVAGSLVAGIAIAGLAGSGIVQGTAVAPASVFQLGSKHTAAHATKHTKSSHKSSKHSWWEAEVGQEEEPSAKKADATEKPAAKKSVTKVESKSSSSKSSETHPTGQITPHEKSDTEKAKEAEIENAKQPTVATSDKSQDMLTRLFGDTVGRSTEEDERAKAIAAAHVDPEELAEEKEKAKADAKSEHIDPLEEFNEEKERDETRGSKTEAEKADDKAQALAKFVADGKEKTKSSSDEPTSKVSEKTSDKSSTSKSSEKTAPEPEEESQESEEDDEEKENDDVNPASDILPADATDSERESWFEAQRKIKEKKEVFKEKKEEKKEKIKEEIEKEEEIKAAMIPVEKERVLTTDGSKEWFVSFTVAHTEKRKVPCEKNHGSAIEEFVGQLAANSKVVPRIMHVGACENPSANTRTYDVDFELGDVFDTKKEQASQQAKELVKLFSTDAVQKLLSASGLGESEAKTQTSGFNIDTSKVKFDQRVKFEHPQPDPASLLEPFPLSENHVGKFVVTGGQTDQQIKNALAQTAINRGMPSDNIPNMNIESCPFDYRVKFDVTVLGFGCPSGEAAEDNAFGEQYTNFVYKYASANDPPVIVPDSLVVSDCKTKEEHTGLDEDTLNDPRESQTLTVQFDMPRVSEHTDPTKLAAAVRGLFTSENIRDHASDVGVSAHALHRLKLGVDAQVPTSELIQDPDSKACTFGEVVFNGQLPPGLEHQAAIARGSAAAGVDNEMGDASGDRMEMMKALSEQVSSGFMSSSSHRVAMHDEAKAAVAQAAMPASAATAAVPAATVPAATVPAATTAARATAATQPATTTAAATTATAAASATPAP